METITTGRLEADKYGQGVCVDCDTAYYNDGENIKCNGHIITVCPWCRPDSKPWTNGRGI